MQYQMQYRAGVKRAQTIDVAIWCALGYSRVAQRTTPIRAIVLVRVNATVQGLSAREADVEPLYLVAVMPAISSLHQPLPLFCFRSCAIIADRRRLTQG